jgi:hypothetical protein
MIKFGGVRNYIIATWDDDDLAACADLNLPCFNATSFLPEPMDRGPNAGRFGTHDYLVGAGGWVLVGWLIGWCWWVLAGTDGWV